jgi:5-formyltetrahydrofolate cyclo-ligase
MPDLIEDKRRLREAAIARRDRTAAAAGGCGEALADVFVAAVRIREGAAVSGFFPFGNEIDVMPLLARLRAAGHEIALPVVTPRGEPLIFRRWRAHDETACGPFGIRQPRDEAPVLAPDLLLVPLLAFDRRGRRLGYGGGYYDRTLTALRADGTPLAVGVAYAAQEVDAVPAAAYDQPLDWVVTEREAIEIGA